VSCAVFLLLQTARRAPTRTTAPPLAPLTCVVRPWSHDPASQMAGVLQPAPRPGHGSARDGGRSRQRSIPVGRISYDAPSGFHDDCVVALALANATRPREPFAALMIPLATTRPALELRALPRSLR